MSLLGLDIGISGCKVVAFGLDGQALAQAYREYRLYQPQPGWMELDPAEVWQAVTEVIGRVTAAVPGDPVRALSVSTHGESVVPVDAAGRPLCRFITAIDTRAGLFQADDGALNAELLNGDLSDAMGQLFHPVYHALPAQL